MSFFQGYQALLAETGKNYTIGTICNVIYEAAGGNFIIFTNFYMKKYYTIFT